MEVLLYDHGEFFSIIPIRIPPDAKDAEGWAGLMVNSKSKVNTTSVFILSLFGKALFSYSSSFLG
jgi:hypothetical protein